MPSEHPRPHRGRQKARHSALQALYQCLMNEREIDAIVEQFEEQGAFNRGDRDYFELLLRGVAEHESELEVALQPHLSREIEQLDPVERAALLLAAFELGYVPDVPARVVIDEAITLAKTFGSSDGYQLVNAALDNLARAVRCKEFDDR